MFILHLKVCNNSLGSVVSVCEAKMDREQYSEELSLGQRFIDDRIEKSIKGRRILKNLVYRLSPIRALRQGRYSRIERSIIPNGKHHY